MVCVDSDVLINFLRNDRKTVSLIENLKSEEKILLTTSINSFELLKGIPAFSKVDKVIVSEFLNNFKILDFNLESSRKAAEIFSKLKAEGNTIDIADIMIASIVITNGETLLTGNVRHFERINELKLRID